MSEQNEMLLHSNVLAYTGLALQYMFSTKPIINRETDDSSILVFILSYTHTICASKKCKAL